MSLTHDLTPDGCNHFAPLLKSSSELILWLSEGSVHISVTLAKYWCFLAGSHPECDLLAKIHLVLLVDYSFVMQSETPESWRWLIRFLFQFQVYLAVVSLRYDEFCITELGHQDKISLAGLKHSARNQRFICAAVTGGGPHQCTYETDEGCGFTQCDCPFWATAETWRKRHVCPFQRGIGISISRNIFFPALANTHKSFYEFI